MAYTYQLIVLDPNSGDQIKSTQGSFYSKDDVTLSTPLTVIDANGVSTTTIATNPKGVLTFTSADQPRGVWKAPFTPAVPVTSVDATDAATEAASDARDAAQAAQAAAEQAAADAQAPTDTAVTNVITTSLADPSTPIAQAVNGSAEATASGVVDSIKPDGGVKAVGKGELRTVDTDYSSLEAALAATADGGTLEVRNVWARTTPWTINKSVTVAFARGGQVTVASGSTDAIRVTVSGVTLQRPYLSGAGSATAGTGCGISAIGTALAPITDLTIERPHLDSYDKYGIYLENVTDFTIDRPAISSIAYAGIMGLSCIRGEVHGGAIRNITQPSGFTNSYGIAWSRDSTKSMTDAPRSADIIIDGVLIDGVTNWEGLDTHAGQNITFRDCQVYNCKTGIAVVSGKGVDNSNTYGPQGCSVQGCRVDGVITNGTRGVGIVVAGAADTLGAPVELAVACQVIDNTVLNMGSENTSTGSSIQIYGTTAARVSGNQVVNSGFSGIDWYHDNYGAICHGNTITDAWSNSASAVYCVQVRSDYNKITFSGNQIVRATKTATHVNDRGLNVAASLSNTAIIDAGGNSWDAATVLPTAGIANLSTFRSFATKTGFNGATPVGKAPNPGTAAGTDAAVINAVITAGRNLGLWT